MGKAQYMGNSPVGKARYMGNLPVGKARYMGMDTGLMVEKRWSSRGSNRDAVVSTP